MRSLSRDNWEIPRLYYQLFGDFLKILFSSPFYFFLVSRQHSNGRFPYGNESCSKSFFLSFFFSRPRVLSRRVCLVGLVFGCCCLLLLSSGALVDVVRSFYVRVFTKPNRPIHLSSSPRCSSVHRGAPVSLDQVSNSD